MTLNITPEDVKNEKRIIEALEEAWLCNIFPTPDVSLVDGVIVAAMKLKAIVEIKVRPTFDSKTMPHFYIDKYKIDESMKMAAALSVPYILVVEDNNKNILFIKNPPHKNYTVKNFQRKRAGESPDLIYQIPSKDLRTVKPVEWGDDDT